MLRPPTSGGRGESGLNDYDDNEIEPRRGRPDALPDDHDDAPGGQPTGGPAMPGDPQSDLPQRLGDRLENGSSSSISKGEPDVLPDVDPPDTTM